MTRKYKRHWSLGVGLAAAVAFSAAGFTPATAFESWAMDTADCGMRINFAGNREISASEARLLARHYLSDLGFTAPRLSSQTARVSSVEADGDKWFVRFVYGGPLPNKAAVFLIDRSNGLIEGP